MAKDKELAQRSTAYSMLVQPDKTSQDAIVRTLNFYNKAGSLAENFISNMMGMVTPQVAKKQLPNFPEIFYFINVFSLEETTYPHARQVIEQSQIPALFHKYWTNEGGGNYDKKIVDRLAKFAHRADFVWVDRKQSFLNFAQNTPNFLVGSEDIHLLFNYKSFPFPKASENQDDTDDRAGVFWRTLFSILYGTGKKTNDDLRRNVAQTCIKIMEKMQVENNNSKIEFGRRLADAFNVNKANIDERLATTTGKKPFYHNYVMCYLNRSEGLIDWNHIVTLKKTVASSKLEANPQWDSLLNYFEKSIGFSYNQNKTCLREELSQAFGLAHGKILSCKSNRINQCILLYNLQKQYDERDVKIDPYVEMLKGLSKHLCKVFEQENYLIRAKQLDGVNEFHRHWQTEPDLESALKKADKGFNGKFAYNFLREFATLYPSLKNEKDITCVHEAFKIYKVENDLNRLRCPGYAAINEEKHPVFPWFGTSKPSASFRKHNGSIVVDMNLFNSKMELAKFSINVQGARAEREIFAVENGPEKIFRKDKYHTGSDEDYSLFSSDIWTSACRLYTKGMWYRKAGNQPKIYLDVAFKLAYPKDKNPVDKTECFLGVDLGWNHPASYGIRNANGVSTETGRLTRLIKSQFTNKDIDLFYDQGRMATNEEIEWANVIIDKQTKDKTKVDRYLVKSRLTFNKLCHKVCKSLSYGVADFADVKDLAEKISPVFVNQSNRNFVYLNRDEVRHGVGGLTANRIELLENLKRLVSRVMSKTEDKKVFVEAELMREKIFKKLNNVKRERFKVTASIILDKAMELKSQGKSVTLCLEDLENMKTDNRNRAWQNKKISSWYTSRIIKQLQELCAANGIKFAAVNAMHTSHKNENNEFTPRLAVFTPEVPYMKKKLEKQFNLWINKKDLTSRRDPSKLSEVYKVYKEAYVGYGVDSFEQLKLKVEIEPHLFHKWEGKPLVACQGGAYMYSPKFGVIDADQMAGLQIAREGILRCERIAAKKMPEVARTG